MLNFEKMEKGLRLIGRPCVFGIFVQQGQLSIAGYTDDLTPDEAIELGSVIVRAAKETQGEEKNGLLGSIQKHHSERN